MEDDVFHEPAIKTQPACKLGPRPVGMVLYFLDMPPAGRNQEDNPPQPAVAGAFS